MNSNFNLVEYMNRGIHGIVKNAMKGSLKNPRESAFLLKYISASKGAEKRRTQHENQGQHIPPFLIASITTKCNLFCKGCYARANNSCHENSVQGQLPSKEWSRVFKEADTLGVSFILLAGGEPLMRKDVIQCASETENIIFPIFTNGTMINEDYIELFYRKRNLVPILSMEGSEAETDDRRGDGVYQILENTMKSLMNRGIFFGASITVTTKNIHEVTQDAFIRSLFQSGCKLIFFVEYVPISPDTGFLAPTEKERDLLEQKLASLRSQYDEMIFLSFPGDEKHTGGCLAAGRGFFHINADGGAEPCPFSPYSDINIQGNSLLDVLHSNLFQRLTASEFLHMEHNGGCVLFDKEAEVKALLSNEPQQRENL